MLSMEKSAFYLFVSNQPLFPKAVEIGKSKGGKSIKRYRKAQVMAFVDLIGCGG